MAAPAPVLDLSGPRATATGTRKFRPLKFAGTIVALLLLLLLVLLAHSPRIDSNAVASAVAQDLRSVDVTFMVDYFPAQFPSPSGEAEAHIQAF
jgi:hypothetical protein